MYRLLLSYGKTPPEYPSQNEAVTLIIRNGTIDERMAKYVGRLSQEGHAWSVEELIVLHHLRYHDIITADDAQYLLQRPLSQASTILGQMEGNFLERFGTGRGTYYRLARKVYDALGAQIKYTRDRGIDETRQLELIRQHIQNYQEISNDVVQRLCGVNRNQAYRLLKQLVDEGIILPPSKGRYAKYRRAI